MRKQLTKVQLSYIRSQMDSLTPEVIAADLKISLARVNEQIQLIRGTVKADILEKFSVISSVTGQPIPGVTVLTPQQSQADDAALGASPFAGTDLTEAQRTYITQQKDQLTAEQLARDTALPLGTVRQVLDSLDPARVGREEFYQRHRKNIHKIRPNEPIR